MKKISILLSIIISLCFISCTKDFEEMNEDWKNPKGTDINSLFNGVISSLRLPSNEQFYLSNEIFYPECELGALTSESWGNYTIGTEEVWSNYYFALANIRDVEERLKEYSEADSNAADVCRAQLAVLKAYKTFKVTDMFGDIPFFEAGKIWYSSENSDYRKPKYDSQEDIYKSLLNELVWAREILLNSASGTPAGNTYYQFDDVLFNGNTDKWARFANSLILRHGLRCYDKDPEFAGPILVEAFDKPVIDDVYGVCLWPTTLNFTNDVSWTFREHKHLRMGETAWRCMSSNDDTLGSGIFDYRVYLFFDTNKGNKNQPNMGNWVPFPQIRNSSTPSEGGSPYSLNRDTRYDLKGEGCIYSPFNYYLTRDEKYIPEILMTAADVLFMKAEIMSRNIVPGDPFVVENNYIIEGMVNSFYFWAQMPQGCERWVYKYPAYDSIIKSTDLYSACRIMAFNVLNYLMTSYDYNLSGHHLEIIYQQRWINLFRQPWEAWSLTRRTMATPTTTDHKKLTSYRMEYPPSEISYNYESYLKAVSNMPFGDSRKSKVWWMTH